MDTVKTKPFYKQCMVLDHKGHVAGMGNFAQCIGAARNPVLILGRQRKADTGDRRAVKAGGQKVRKGFNHQFGRRDEVQLGQIVARVGHGAGLIGWVFARIARFSGLDHRTGARHPGHGPIIGPIAAGHLFLPSEGRQEYC